jgi:hypothetical protein
MLVLEYLDGGDLKGYLNGCDPKGQVDMFMYGTSLLWVYLYGSQLRVLMGQDKLELLPE